MIEDFEGFQYFHDFQDFEHSEYFGDSGDFGYFGDGRIVSPHSQTVNRKALEPKFTIGDLWFRIYGWA